MSYSVNMTDELIKSEDNLHDSSVPMSRKDSHVENEYLDTGAQNDSIMSANGE